MLTFVLNTDNLYSYVTDSQQNKYLKVQLEVVFYSLPPCHKLSWTFTILLINAGGSIKETNLLYVIPNNDLRGSPVLRYYHNICLKRYVPPQKKA